MIVYHTPGGYFYRPALLSVWRALVAAVRAFEPWEFGSDERCVFVGTINFALSLRFF
ncbi:MAG: hypothetical protein AAF384_16525 [Pseudomonadota bacterium]